MTKTLIVLTHDITGEKYVVEAPEGFHAGGGSVSAELQQVHTQDDLPDSDTMLVERGPLLVILKALYDTGRNDIAARLLFGYTDWPGGECIAALEEWFNATRHARRQPAMESGVDWAAPDSRRTVKQDVFVAHPLTKASWETLDRAGDTVVVYGNPYVYVEIVRTGTGNDDSVDVSLSAETAREFANALLWFASRVDEKDGK